MFETDFAAELQTIEHHLKHVMKDYLVCPAPELEPFWQCLNYALFSGGKRFRPLLSVLTARALGRPPEDVLPVAAAVELIHSYSLVHDDLPSMDNDDFRRGQPTVHKKFGEPLALLAGDALQTAAFLALSESRSPELGAALRVISEAAGAQGMVAGQVLDVEAKDPSETTLLLIHQLKTGALIRVSVEAAALISLASDEQSKRLTAFGEHLGLAFQLADDLEDHKGDAPEKVSFVRLKGLEGTQELLRQTSATAIGLLAPFGKNGMGLAKMVELNLSRVSV